MSVRLSIAFGTLAESWLNQPVQYDLWHTERSRKTLKVSKLAAFLPPREHANDNGLRAVVFVRALQPKGTNRSAQEYPNPLLALTGKECSAISFDELHATLTNALRGVRPKVIGEVIAPGGSVRVLYEDGLVGDNHPVRSH